MISPSGRYVIVLNGEIYNFSELRSELEERHYKFRGHSDTEIALAAFEEWGIERSVRKFNGMFAFAVWDSHLRCLVLCRDRLGEKPLYYGWAGTTFLFASELKAIRAYPSFAAKIDLTALSSFFKFGYVPTPLAIYKGVQKLPAGHILRISDPKYTGSIPDAYWSLAEVAGTGLRTPFQGTQAEALDRVHSLLANAVRAQMVSDVPLGAFLSGGIDSSLVVALMQSQSAKPIKTFTIGYDDSQFDEAVHARRVAAHLQTEHTELYVSAKQAMQVIPELPYVYDEPFSDSSQIPTFLVAQLARRDVTVSLSGDGGDEVFGGYNRYLSGEKLWNSIAWLPHPLRRVIGKLLLMAPDEMLDQTFGVISAFKNSYGRPGIVGDKVHKLAEILDSTSKEEFYWGLASQCRRPRSLIAITADYSDEMALPKQQLETRDFTQLMMYLDSMCYLQDDILVKVDRAAMRVGLETRAPFLDCRVVEFAWSLPMWMKIRNGQGKQLLRSLVAEYVPRQLFGRPKHGFAVPIGEWLRGPLREWAEDLLNENRIEQQGFLNAATVREQWLTHLSRRRNRDQQLWTILMFQSWLQKESEQAHDEVQLQLS